MADKPTVNIKVSGKKTGKNDKFTIDEKEHQTYLRRSKPISRPTPTWPE
jgi:hypothetical protein